MLSSRAGKQSGRLHLCKPFSGAELRLAWPDGDTFGWTPRCMLVVAVDHEAAHAARPNRSEVHGGAFAGELFLTTLQLQQARGLGVILTGAAFLPLTAPMVLNPPLAGRLIARIGPALPVFGGLLLITAGSGVLAAVPNNAPFAWIAVGLILLGLGMSFTLPALTSAVVLAAPAEAAGAASGLFSVLRQTGTTVGVAAMAAVIGAHATDAQHGHILIAIAALAAAVTWLMVARLQPTRPVGSGRLRTPRLRLAASSPQGCNSGGRHVFH